MEARKTLTLEELHADALLREQGGHGRSCRSAADHYDIWIRCHITRTQLPTTNYQPPLTINHKPAGLHLEPRQRSTRDDVDADGEAQRFSKLIRHARGNRCTVAGLRTEL